MKNRISDNWKFTVLVLVFAAFSAGGAVEQKAGVTITLTGNDMMKYNKSSFTVRAGQKVKLVLKNVGKLPKIAMGHNVVILKSNVDPAKFAAEALKFPKQDYIPKTRKRNIVAHTKMIGGGETTSIVFTAPKKRGKYPYLCTFPGHFVLMKGVMVVK